MSMEAERSAVVWEIALLVLPALAMLVTAWSLWRSDRRAARPRQRLTRAGFTATVVLLVSIVLVGALVIVSVGSDGGWDAVLFWLGMGMLLTAGLVLCLVRANVGGAALVLLSVILPMIVFVTGGRWIVDDHAGEPTPESGFLGASAMTLLFAVPGLLSGILFLLAGRAESTGDGSLRQPQADRPTESRHSRLPSNRP
ncbi:MAG: hypothetical protein H6525_08010 [Actinobacteria bacterium]|nr:hypothetical protein [Actinomycetota bacterium]